MAASDVRTSPEQRTREALTPLGMATSLPGSRAGMRAARAGLSSPSSAVQQDASKARMYSEEGGGGLYRSAHHQAPLSKESPASPRRSFPREPCAGWGLLSGQSLTRTGVSGRHQGSFLQIVAQISSLRQHPPSVRVDEVARRYGPGAAAGWQHCTVGARNHQLGDRIHMDIFKAP